MNDKEEQCENALAPIRMRLCGATTKFRCEQLENASFPIAVIPSEINILLMLSFVSCHGLAVTLEKSIRFPLPEKVNSPHRLFNDHLIDPNVPENKEQHPQNANCSITNSSL